MGRYWQLPLIAQAQTDPSELFLILGLCVHECIEFWAETWLIFSWKPEILVEQQISTLMLETA